MHFVIRNINHIAVPMGMMLALFGAWAGYSVQRNRRLGLPPAPVSNAFRAAMFVVIVVCAVLLGIALGTNSASPS